jgi:hypothetical protein
VIRNDRTCETCRHWNNGELGIGFYNQNLGRQSYYCGAKVQCSGNATDRCNVAWQTKHELDEILGVVGEEGS